MRLRALPQVERLMARPDVQALQVLHGRSPTLTATRAVLEAAREDCRPVGAIPPDEAAIACGIAARLQACDPPRLLGVINATGVVLHTNLGRAPMAQVAVQAAARAAGGYINLEYDLKAGRRGMRTQGVEPLLCEVTGAPAALAVNNAAAAVLLALSALADGGEVIVSRGELVEIGGGFRIPEVITQGGARLVEVGTTNKTRLADYAAAITPSTRMLLKVHPSNYRMVGFTGEASLQDLGALASTHGLILMHDLGGGALIDLRKLGLNPEPTVQESLAAGVDLVAFSGDKLMGGPQAGLLVGRAEALEPLRRHPLLRALRLDKMSLAALEATLRLYRDPPQALAEVPVLAMLAQPLERLQDRAERLGYALDVLAPGLAAWSVTASEAFAGGGTLPGQGRESRALVLAADHVEALAARLRQGAPPVLGRLAEGRLVLDMLTVDEAELDLLAQALADALRTAL